MENKIETNKERSEGTKMLVDRIDLIQNKFNEFERKLINLTKLVDVQSSIGENRNTYITKNDNNKINSLIEKKINE